MRSDSKMNPSLAKKIKNLPDSPGVYLFSERGGKTENEKILYIGKATSLRNRVRSYFNGNLLFSRSPLIAKMVEEIKNIKYQKTDSVLEALILEANLIKKYKPKYNTQEKDDRSWNYIVITDEDFPRILTIRQKELALDPKPYTLMASFGPFPHGNQLKEALRILRKIFPFYSSDTKNTQGERFYKEIGLAPNQNKSDYQKTISHLKLFLEGKKKQIIFNLEKEMRGEVKKLNFEKAGELRNKIFALKHIQDIALLKNLDESGADQGNFRIESYDVAHISGTFMVGVMVVLEEGIFKKSQYRKFKIKKTEGGDTSALSEIIDRRFNHTEWQMPNLVCVDGGIAQKNVAEKILRKKGLFIPVVSVVKDKKHKPKQILGDRKTIGNRQKEILLINQEAHRFALSFHKKLRDKIN